VTEKRILAASAACLALSQPLAAQDLPQVEALDPSSRTYPNLSPDGRYLLYSEGEGFALDIYRRDLETGAVLRLTASPHEDSAASWSPDGQWIAFQRETADGNRDIWLIRADGSEPRNFSATPGIGEQHPRFTPDGTAILHDGNRHDDGVEGGLENYEIYRVPLAGGAPERLTGNPHWDLYPAPAPDGRAMAWVRALPVTDKDRPDFDVFMTDFDSGETRNLSDSPGYDTTPDWSPTGEWIVFASDRGAERYGRTDLYLIRPDGTDLRRVTDNGGTSMAFTRPRFAPDGRSLLASRSVAGVTDIVRIELGELLD